MRRAIAACGLVLLAASSANAAPVTDPNDIRTWQGASVGTFAQLFYFADNATTRQQVIDNQLLDDGLFNPIGATPAPMIAGGGATGISTDLTGTGSYAYIQPPGLTPAAAGSTVDNTWVQTSGTVGVNIWDLGAPAVRAAIFNTIDHGPLPGEAIESTVYLSNDMINWTQAVTQKVWLEGFMTNTAILWDGFAYAVGTPGNTPFRYASIRHGGPGSLIQDGDNEINGILGLDINFTPVNPVPIPPAMALFATGLAGLGWLARRRRKQAA